MSENSTEQTNVDTTGLIVSHEGFSQLVTANKQDTSNSKEKGFSGVVDANSKNIKNASSSNKSNETK